MFDPLYYLGVMVVIMMLTFVVVIITCMSILKRFPHSKLSGFIRRHILTDIDLEP